MSVDFTKLIADIRAKMAATGDRLAELREKRRPHALGAVSGDEKARAAVAKIAAEEAAARGEEDTLALALEEAEKRQAEAEQQAAEEDRRRREQEAERIKSEIADLASDIDRTASALTDLLEKRSNLVSALRATGTVYDGYIKGLQRPGRLRAAMWAAGLGRFELIEHVDGHQRRPLVEADSRIVGGAEEDAA